MKHIILVTFLFGSFSAFACNHPPKLESKGIINAALEKLDRFDEVRSVRLIDRNGKRSVMVRIFDNHGNRATKCFDVATDRLCTYSAVKKRNFRNCK